MAESLYRSGGNLVRVPNDGGGYYWGAVEHYNKLWRGVEICCPSWEIGYGSNYLAPIAGVAGSVYTPKYITVTDISGIIDCPLCDPDGEELNNIGGATKVLLTQSGAFGAARHMWTGTWVGPTRTWSFVLWISAGHVGNFGIGELAGGPDTIAFKYTSAPGVNFDPRWGPTWASDYVVGGCCAADQGCHSGTATFASGDLT